MFFFFRKNEQLIHNVIILEHITSEMNKHLKNGLGRIKTQSW